MSQGLTLALIMGAVAAAIIIGYITKNNIGIIAMLLAYVLGVFVFDMGANAVLGCWPSGLLLTMISIMLFYGYATANGTLKLLAEKIIYPFRKFVRVLPLIVFVCAVVLASLAGNTAVTAFFPVLCFTIALSAGFDCVLFSAISCFGSLIGASMPWAQTGVIISGVLNETEAAADVESLGLAISIKTILAFFLLIVILYFATKAYKVKSVEMEKPAKFTSTQMRTIAIMLIVAILVIVPSLTKVLAPTTFLGQISGRFNLGLICFFGAAINAFLHLADEKEVIRRIPWGTFIMICGMATLVTLASSLGATQFLGSVIGNGMPLWLIAPALVLISAGMSLFSSYTAVLPIMMPVAVSVSLATGLSTSGLLTACFAGAACTTVSPFSSGGMMTMSQCPDENERNELFNKQFIVAVCSMIFMTLISALGLFNL